MYEDDEAWAARLERSEIRDAMVVAMGPRATRILALRKNRNIAYDGYSWNVGHMVLLTTKGEVLTCGYGSYGQLGHGDDEPYQWEPKVVASLVRNKLRIVQVAAGASHTVLLTDKGEVLTCGRGGAGRLGHGDDQSNQLEPKVVQLLYLYSCTW